MIDLKWLTRYLVRRPTKVSTLTLCVASNKTLRTSEASGASEAWQMSQLVRANQAGAGGPVQADRTVNEFNFSGSS